jgi:hypothetical protein
VSRKHVRKGYVIRSPSLEATATHRRSVDFAAKDGEKLGVGPSTYAVYENANLYKKPHLPIDLARKLAAIFADHGIEPAEVMKLAGLVGEEVAPKLPPSKLPARRFNMFRCRSPCLVKVRCAICSIACWLWFPRAHREPKSLKF